MLLVLFLWRNPRTDTGSARTGAGLTPEQEKGESEGAGGADRGDMEGTVPGVPSAPPPSCREYVCMGFLPSSRRSGRYLGSHRLAQPPRARPHLHLWTPPAHGCPPDRGPGIRSRGSGAGGWGRGRAGRVATSQEDDHAPSS